MSEQDYRAPFEALSADLSAIIVLLGFDSYSGVDPVLRRITDLLLNQARTDSGLLAEIERLKGITPELPPRPPEGGGLPRYGLRWNGPSLPLAVGMGDGYWTPWHLASKAVDDYSDMLSRTSLECGERLDAMEKRLAERDALLRELHTAWEESEGHEALFGAMGKVAVLLYASAEPATQCKRCLGVGTIPGRDRDGSPTEEWCPEGCRDGFEAQYDEPAKGAAGEAI